MENINNVNKISIIGGPGTGKSTLARSLGKDLEIPFYHIDGIHHLENWAERNKEERDNIITDLIEKEKWIIDGTYKSTLKKRIDKSDIVIFLNYSKIARLKGILGRYLKNKDKEKPDIPGCREKMSFTFMKFAYNWDTDKGNVIKEHIDNTKFLIFKNRKSLNKWYEEKFNKKIDLMQ